MVCYQKKYRTKISLMSLIPIGISTLATSATIAGCGSSKITYVAIPIVAIPINDSYFKITDGNTICGFSDAVVADPSCIPVEYNAIDFTDKSITNILYVSADANFSSYVFSQHTFRKLNLSELKFHFNSDGCSGYDLFNGCDLSSVIELNLENADFAGLLASDFPLYTGAAYTATNTFYGANLSKLTNLNLTGTVFATENMATNESVYVADDTFLNANLSMLSDLYLPSSNPSNCD